MAKSELRLQALALRRKGKSIKDIAKELGIARSSASVWCRDIILTNKQKELLFSKQIQAGHKGRMMGAESNRRKKFENIVEQEALATSLVGQMTDRDKFILGVGLYWGEGVKAQGSTTALVNSDPAIILFARDWFEQLGVSRGSFLPRIFISDMHRSREQKIKKFWAAILQVPESQFSKTIFIKTKLKKVYENHDSYYGVLALRVRKGTTLKYLIRGLIRECAEKGGVKEAFRPFRE